MKKKLFWLDEISLSAKRLNRILRAWGQAHCSWNWGAVRLRQWTVPNTVGTNHDNVHGIVGVIKK
jgi:hypothetical protein